MQTRTWGVLLALLLAAHFGGCGSKNLTGAGGSAATGSGVGGDGVGGTAGGTGSDRGGVGGIAGGAGCPYGLAGMTGAGGTPAASGCATTFTCGVDGARCLLGEDVCLFEGNASAGGVSGNTSSSSCTSLPAACKGLPTCECVCPGGHCSFGPNCTCTMGVPGPGAVGISCDTGGNHAGGRGGAGGIGGTGGTGGGGRGGGGIAGGAGCPYGLAGMTGTGGLPGGSGGIGGTNPICQPAPRCGDRSCVLGQEYCRSLGGGAGRGGPGGQGGAPPLPPSPMCVALPPQCAGDPSCACLCPLGNGRCLNQFCTCQELSQLAISCGE